VNESSSPVHKLPQGADIPRPPPSYWRYGQYSNNSEGLNTTETEADTDPTARTGGINRLTTNLNHLTLSAKKVINENLSNILKENKS